MEMTFQDTLNLILKASNEGVWDWLVGEEDIFYSDKVFEFLGYDLDEDVPNLFTQTEEVLHEADRAYFKTMLDLTLADADEELFAVDCRVVRKDGRKRWLRIRGIVTWKDGRAERITGSVIDISKRKRAEAALQEERSMLRLVIDHVPVQVFFKNEDSEYVLVNQRQCEWLGAENPEELLGATPESYFAGDSWARSRANDLRIMKTGEAVVDEVFKESWKDKDDTYVQLVKRPWYDSRGKLKGTFGISTDVTKLMMAQEKLEGLAMDLQKRNRDYRDQLRLAREVQQALLPDRQDVWEERLAGVSDDAEVSKLYVPATELAGDYYDVLPLGDRKVGLFMADVMGHGVRSALVVNMIKGVMEKAMDSAEDAGEFMGRLNKGLRRILGRSEVHMFATACYVVLDFDEDRAWVVCAGHDYPVVHWRDGVEGAFDPTSPKGPALGLFDGAGYEAVGCSISDFKCLLMFTDGIYESANADGEEWGLERLEATFLSCCAKGVEVALDKVQSAGAEWVGEKGFDDDVCLLGVSVRNGGDDASS